MAAVRTAGLHSEAKRNPSESGRLMPRESPNVSVNRWYKPPKLEVYMGLFDLLGFPWFPTWIVKYDYDVDFVIFPIVILAISMRQSDLAEPFLLSCAKFGWERGMFQHILLRALNSFQLFGILFMEVSRKTFRQKTPVEPALPTPRCPADAKVINSSHLGEFLLKGRLQYCWRNCLWKIILIWKYVEICWNMYNIVKLCICM